MADITVNRWRTARGAVLRAKMDALRAKLGRDLRVLDVGGRPDYWENVGVEGCAEIILLNFDEGELDRASRLDMFENRVGDARDLSAYDDKSFDLVHSNSVIEHVGLWSDMQDMAREVTRVGVEGWVQTPAWEFPIEPHYRLPAAHWLPAPMRRAYLRVTKSYGSQSVEERRWHVDRINLVSYSEVKALFPEAEIWIERFMLLPKSYVARW